MGLFTFGASNTAVGVDIGTSSIKVVQLKKAPTGPELAGYAMGPIPHGAVEDGQIKDAPTVAAVLKDMLKVSKIRPDRSFASISGQNVIMRFTKLPTMTPDELDQTVRIEAEQYVPYAIDEVSITHAVLQEVAEEEGGTKLSILLVVAQKELVNTYLDCMKQGGVTPEIIDVDTLATINSLESSIMATASSQEGGEVVAIIDTGARTTNISVLKSGILMFTRNIPIAGNNITTMIQNVMKQDTFDSAEQMKVSEAEVSISDSAGNEISEVVKTTVEELVSEIRRSFDYFKAQSREPLIHRIILSGGGSNLRNFDNYLSNEIGVDVARGNPLEGINVTVSDTDALFANL
ncbi:MAG TPA: type IV pilus assembly protein PilM, partial [Candidatus Ozemobacteraceae bacterium]|nr:type IV pilus assembly protein PilM [Candidatus Ozemobacteraceae bacterium]